ncbi:MAG TPA: hypothetical protein IAC41_12495 [Candidatus Merdenecus merdavium]|nr:hypothetical protein [Candidatus Merdenecus merdavium]
MEMDTILLNEIYQNSKMGIETIGQIKQLVHDTTFKKLLNEQGREYYKINQEAKEKIWEKGEMVKGISRFAKMNTHLAIGMKTAFDKSPSHISEMLIQGSATGIIEASRNKNKYKDVDKDILKLNDKLLKTEENNVEQLKKFL